MNWAEHSERVIGQANEMLRLAVDRESSMRGFLITGDESFLAPYETGGPKFKTQIEALQELVSDNPPQVERLKQIQAIQQRWSRYAEEMIDARRRNQNFEAAVASGRGKIEFDETRREFDDFLDVELHLRQDRTEATRRVTTTLVSVFLLFSLIVSGLLAWMGRRELLSLSSTYDGVLRQQSEQTEVLQAAGVVALGTAPAGRKSGGPGESATGGPRDARLPRAISRRGGRRALRPR